MFIEKIIIFRLLIGMLIINAILFSSCGENQEEEIIGKWEITGVSVPSAHCPFIAIDDGSYWEFKSNGKLLICSQYPKEIESKTYSIDGSILTIESDEETEVLSFEIEDDEMILRDENSGDAIFFIKFE